MARERSFDEWSAQMVIPQPAQSNNPFRRKPVGGARTADISPARAMRTEVTAAQQSANVFRNPIVGPQASAVE